MRAVILAAGKGTRLYPLTKDIPKPMVPIGDRPLLEHVLLNLRNQGIEDVVINLHYKPEAITGYFGNGERFKLRIEYSYEPKLLGTAGAIKRAENRLSQSFLIVYGDNLCYFNLKKLVDFHQKKQGLATMALTKGTNPFSGGIAEMNGDQRIVRFLERPKLDQVSSPWINAGIYLCEPAILDHIPRDDFYDFGHHLFPKLVSSEEALFGYELADPLRGVNTLQEYVRAQLYYWETIEHAE